MATGTQAAIIFSTIPKSKNVSEHTTVTFECSTSEHMESMMFTLTTTPPAIVAYNSFTGYSDVFKMKVHHECYSALCIPENGLYC